ncbi:MAG: DNA-binding MarR family transcriptional regulator/GNAT superfamily N-acetyltransferase [Planctomycetota bacterium]|jgi:DNA-binding MarR family transcriptional regulator/GNAT superfamily N-acetyltransferase
MDFYDELGELALGSRLKRLADRLGAQATKVFQADGIAFEPRYFPLTALLLSEGEVSVSDAAKRLGISQPAASQICKQMESEDWLKLTSDPKDGRRRLFALSSTGKRRAKSMEDLWDAVRSAAIDLCMESRIDLIAALANLERALGEQPLHERVATKLESGLRMRPYTKELAHYFLDINLEWIDEMFTVEDIDMEVLSNPEHYILKPGGQVWFAELGGLGIVGAGALMKTGESAFELTKMGVLASTRGKQVGEALLRRMIYEAKRLKAERLYLLTNAKCEAAIHLYLRNGFVHSKEIMDQYGAAYERCDVAMLYV